MKSKQFTIQESANIVCDKCNVSQTDKEKVIKWLYEFMTANDLTLREISNMCLNNAEWIFNSIFMNQI